MSYQETLYTESGLAAVEGIDSTPLGMVRLGVGFVNDGVEVESEVLYLRRPEVLELVRILLKATGDVTPADELRNHFRRRLLELANAARMLGDDSDRGDGGDSHSRGVSRGKAYAYRWASAAFRDLAHEAKP